jgi:hypothetical protein
LIVSRRFRVGRGSARAGGRLRSIIEYPHAWPVLVAFGTEEFMGAEERALRAQGRVDLTREEVDGAELVQRAAVAQHPFHVRAETSRCRPVERRWAWSSSRESTDVASRCRAFFIRRITTRIRASSAR